MPESGDGLKPNRNRFAEKLHRVGAKASAGITAFSIALGAIGPGHADNPEVPPPKIEDVSVGVNTSDNKPQLSTNLNHKIIMPGLSSDKTPAINNGSEIPNYDAVVDWLTSDLDQSESQINSIGTHVRDCKLLKDYFIGCSSDFGYGTDAPGIFKSEFGKYDPLAGDGWDIIKITKDWVSIIGTRDHTGEQLFLGFGCNVGDGWMLFPTDFVNDLHDGKEGEGVFLIRQAYVDENGNYNCPPENLYDKTHTKWKYLEDFEFKDGVKRDTIVVEHSHSEKPEESGKEVFYFTKEEGLLQWQSVDKDDNVLDGHLWSDRQPSKNNKKWVTPNPEKYIK